MFKSWPSDEFLDMANALRHLGLHSFMVLIHNYIQVTFAII